MIIVFSGDLRPLQNARFLSFPWKRESMNLDMIRQSALADFRRNNGKKTRFRLPPEWRTRSKLAPTIPVVSGLSHTCLSLQVSFSSALRRRQRRWSVARTWGPGWCGCAASRFCLIYWGSRLSGLTLHVIFCMAGWLRPSFIKSSGNSLRESNSECFGQSYCLRTAILK